MTSHDLQSEIGTVKDDLAKLRADIVNLSSALKDLTSQTVQERFESLQGGLDKLTDDARVRGKQKLDDLTDHIEEQPLTSVLIAFGVGLLIGRLLDR